MTKTRKEADSMGAIDVPADALYAAQTARAVTNFPISGWAMPKEFIHALAAIKLSAAMVNKRAGRLKAGVADAIIAAAGEAMAGRHDAHFPLDVFQTGSGTSSNMNMNEVLANRAMQILKGAEVVHPNDHVNMGQSSNDVVPAAIHVAAAAAISENLLPALAKLKQALARKARAFDSIVKIGRTHLMDAVPIRLGQEFSGYSAQIDHAGRLLRLAMDELYELPIGGTAVGTGLNAPKGFGGAVCKELAGHVSGKWREASNHFAAQAAKDAAVFASGVLKATAIVMGKIASDVRLLASGPACGLGEIVLPAVQPGSSIMPGKVNPVICESVIQVACQVVGADAAITAAATGGVGSILELNMAMPVLAANLLDQVRLLTNVAGVFESKCVAGLRANKARCNELVERSLAMVTVLAPRIGYDRCAALVKEAQAGGKTIRQICIEKNVLPKAELNRLLDAGSQTGR